MENNCNGVIHQVVSGDTLYKLSKLYGVRLIDIIKENPYVNVYNLQVGDEICIPTEIYEEDERRYYSTRPGDTFETVLNNMSTDIQSLMDYNKELYNLRLPFGTILRIPPQK